MRPALATLGSLVIALALAASTIAPAAADEAKAKTSRVAKVPPEGKTYCAPEVSELSDHVCYFEGGAPADGRKTLVIYLHGALAQTPGFFYMQQRAMALHAKKHGFTVTSHKMELYGLCRNCQKLA